MGWATLNKMITLLIKTSGASGDCLYKQEDMMHGGFCQTGGVDKCPSSPTLWP